MESTRCATPVWKLTSLKLMPSCVVVEHVEVVGEVRDVDVVAAVIVVVADGHAHVGLLAAIAVERRAGRIADVLERPAPTLR